MPLPKIIIIGGGVAGLSAAHELKERGFNVTVYERKGNPHSKNGPVSLGGKARSFPAHPANAFAWPSNDQATMERNAARIEFQPAEHGFRFFPGFYRHVIHTMQRIPAGENGTVFDNLIDVEECAFAQVGKPLFLIPTKFPLSPRKFLRAIKIIFSNPSLGLTWRDVFVAAAKLLRGMCMCQERREAVLENIDWQSYMEPGGEMSSQYERVVVDGLSQNFVALDAHMTSTKTAITILARLSRDLLTPGRALDRILNGPTSETWIEPWNEYLAAEQPGQPAVNFLNAEIVSLRYDANARRVTGFELINGSLVEDSEAIYILAVPVEAAVKIISRASAATPDIVVHAPSLANIQNLKVNWMSGIQYYLNRDVEMCAGHISYLHSKWAITSISQNQFWRVKFTDPRPAIAQNAHIAGAISIILSDWDSAGNMTFTQTPKEANSTQQIAIEAFEQIRAHIAGIVHDYTPELDAAIETEVRLPDDLIAGYCLDPAVTLKRDLIGLKSAGNFVALLRDWVDLPEDLAEKLEAILKSSGLPEPGATDAKIESALEQEPSIVRDKIIGLLTSLWGAHFKDWLSNTAMGIKFLGLLDRQPSQHSELIDFLRENYVDRINAQNEEPLFINTTGSSAFRPDAVTGIPNLFLASDYVKTNTDLATMEGANEAARRAVNGILDRLQSDKPRCDIFTFPELLLLTPFRWIDWALLRLGC